MLPEQTHDFPTMVKYRTMGGWINVPDRYAPIRVQHVRTAELSGAVLCEEELHDQIRRYGVPRLICDGTDVATQQQVTPGSPANQKLAWDRAEAILKDETRRPPPGRGRPTKLVRLVYNELTNEGYVCIEDTVRRWITSGRQAWEKKNPDK